MQRVAKPIVARWSDWSGGSSEHLVLRQDRQSVVAESVFVSAEDHPYALRYRIACDAAWRVRDAEIRVVGDERLLRLTTDGAGHWFDEVGNALPHLDGAIDVDLLDQPRSPTPCRSDGSVYSRASPSKSLRRISVRLS